jgi:hypothetical protein
MKLLLRNHHEKRLQLPLLRLRYQQRKPRFPQLQQRQLQILLLQLLQLSFPLQLQLQQLPSLRPPRPGLNKFLCTV